MERRSYASIDVVKFLMAVFVLLIHTNPLMDVNMAAEWFLRSGITVIAVPFFFMATGYFALSSSQATKKSLKKLAVLYIIWSIIYLPFSLLQLKEQSPVVLHYIRRFFLEGSYDTIWYLLASVVGLAIVYMLKRWKGITFAFVVMLIFHILAIMGTSYTSIIANTPLWKGYEFYFDNFTTFKNGLFFGGVYIALGGLVFEKFSVVSNFLKHRFKFMVLIVGLFLVMALETIGCELLDLNRYGVDMKFTLIPLSVCIFVFVLTLQLNISEKISIFLRKMSTLIFLTQRLFLTGYELLGIQKYCHSFVWFLLVSVSTILFSWCVIALSSRCSLLKKIY